MATITPANEAKGLLIQLAAVGVFTLIAGISNDVGTLVVIFMVGMWILFLITNPTITAKIGNAATNAAKY